MAEEKVGIKTGISAKLEQRDEKGKVKKTTYFFPDLNVSVEAETQAEALELAQAKAKK
jgi:hypothetical protein